MVSAINSALSGLKAAGTKLAVASNNIANMHSTQQLVNGEVVNAPYKEQQVVQTSLDTGGVKVEVRESTLPPIKVYAPDHADANAEGFVEMPNVNLERQMVDTMIVRYDYKANLKSIDIQDELFQNLLDIRS